MDGLRAGEFVDGDTLEFVDVSPEVKLLTGEIACKGGIIVDVNKTLEVLSGEGLDAIVQTTIYNYNVLIRNQYNIFRYDNAHPRREHPDDHHKHCFDWQTGEPLPDSPEWIGAKAWPNLTEVILEAQRWYSDHIDELEDPDYYPELDMRGK